jgi:hypothetical protein
MTEVEADRPRRAVHLLVPGLPALAFGALRRGNRGGGKAAPALPAALTSQVYDYLAAALVVTRTSEACSVPFMS